MEEIDRLIDALDGIGSAFLEFRRPGLSASALEAVATEHTPWWVDYIDDDIVAWYSWQHGVDGDAVRASEEAVQACSVISPCRTTLMGVHELFDPGVWEVRGDDMARSLGETFPLARIDGTGSHLFAHRRSSGEEWRMARLWHDGYELDSLPDASGSRSDPTLREWLSALANAMEQGRFELGQRGNVDVVGGWRKHGNPRIHEFPWPA